MKKSIEFLFLGFIAIIILLIFLSLPIHVSFDEVKEILSNNKNSISKLTVEFSNQNKIESVVRRDVRNITFGLPLSLINDNDITFIITTSDSKFEIKVNDGIDEINFWNKNFNEIQATGINLEQFILKNEINIDFLKDVINFLIKNKAYRISKFWNRKFVLINFERDEGLINIFNSELNISDLEFGYEIRKIDESWYFIKEK